MADPRVAVTLDSNRPRTFDSGLRIQVEFAYNHAFRRGYVVALQAEEKQGISRPSPDRLGEVGVPGKPKPAG
jgi:hypothetical protein